MIRSVRCAIANVKWSHAVPMGWSIIALLAILSAGQVFQQMLILAENAAGIRQYASLAIIAVIMGGAALATRLFASAARSGQPMWSHWTGRLGILILGPVLIAATLVAAVLVLGIYGIGGSLSLAREEMAGPLVAWLGSVLVGWRVVPSAIALQARPRLASIPWLALAADVAFGIALLALTIWSVIWLSTPFWLAALMTATGLILVIVATIPLLRLAIRKTAAQT